MIAPEQRRRVESRWGTDGAAWLERLPELVAALSLEWSLEDVEPLVPGGHSGLVFTCRASGKAAVLKVLYEVEDAVRETRALGFWHERNVAAVPDLYAAKVSQGVLLLEHLGRVTPLSASPDTPDLERRLATLLADLHLPLAEPHPFGGVEGWFDRWVKNGDYRPLLATGLYSEDEVAAVLSLGEGLIASLDRPTLVHGDVHHDNVLETSRGLVAVDPYGFASEPAFDVAVWSAKRGREREIGERATRLGALLGLAEERVEGWTRVLALDSAKMYAEIAPHEPERVRALVAYLRR